MLAKAKLFFTALLFGAVALADTVTLQPNASPSAAQPGASVSVTGSGFPTGTINAAQVTVSLKPATANAGPSAAVAASAVTLVAGSTRRVTFTVPASLKFAAATAYLVTVNGTAAAGTVFQSGNSAAFTVNPAPSLLSVTPNSAAQGQTVTVQLTGIATGFVQGSTSASFGAGIGVGGNALGSAGPVTVTSATTAVATIIIDPSAASGARNVTVQTGAIQAGLSNAFAVLQSAPQTSVITLDAIASPASATPGAQISISGTGFPTGTIDPTKIQVGLAPSGAGASPSLRVTVASITPASGPTRTVAFVIPTSLNVNAATPYSVSLAGTSATNIAFASANRGALTITPAPTAPAIVSVTPASALPGNAVLLSISAQNTHFSAATTKLSMGAGITVSGLTVTSPTTLTATAGIAASASAGVRSVVITTGSEVVTLSSGFQVSISVVLTAPANLSYLNRSPVTVNGRVTDSSASVFINGIAAPVANGAFSAPIPLIEGANIISAVAQTSSGAAATASADVTLDTTPPHVSIDSPANSFVTSDSVITVRGLVNDIVLGTVNGGQAQVTVNGVAAQVANRGYVATGVPLVPGDNLIQVLGQDRAGNGAFASIHVQRQVTAQSRISVLSGDNQTAAIGTALAQPLIAIVKNAGGQPVANQPVVFSITASDGALSSGGVSARSVVVQSDTQGTASVLWTLGTRAGAGNNAVSATATGFQGPASFTATALSGAPASLLVDIGNNQTGAAGQQLPTPLVVVVTDSGHNRIANVPVTFTVTQGDGNFGGASVITITSDTDGRAQAFFTLGSTEGASNNIATAAINGNPNLNVTFIASALIPGDPSKTTVSGVVLDNSNVPIQGVTMRLYLRNAASQASPWQLVSNAIQTDAQGQFQFNGSPVGLVKVDVDGSTAQRAGTWAHLEFEFVTVPGRNNTSGAPIYLLPLDTDHQLCVSPAAGGTLTVPSIPGFSLTVQPDSVTFPGGSRSGCITVTVVHPDKVPMAPTFGIQPRFVVTIQPPGMRIDPPATLQVPNVDGLPPGRVIEMFSYDHDLVQFVSIGPGTVSEDGMVIRSNPGVGIIKGGWHPQAPPNPQRCLLGTSSCTFPSGQCSLGSYSITSLDVLLDSVSSSQDSRTVAKSALKPRSAGSSADTIYVSQDQDVTLTTKLTDNCPSLQYVWDFADGSSPETTTAPTVTHHFRGTGKNGQSDPGTYTVTVSVNCLGTSSTTCATKKAGIVVVVVGIQLFDSSGTLISDSDQQPSSVVVGAKVALTAKITPSGLGITNEQWIIGGEAIKSYVQTGTLATRLDLSTADLSQEMISFYWLKGAIAMDTTPVEFDVMIEGQSFSGKTTFFVNRPLASLTSRTTSLNPAMDVRSSPCPSSQGEEFVFGSCSDPGITYSGTVTASTGEAGTIAFVQRTTGQIQVIDNDSSGTVKVRNLPSDWVLDSSDIGVIQYGGITGTNLFAFIGDGTSQSIQNADIPGVTLSLAFRDITRNQNWETYLMYRPAGTDSIWVSLAYVAWSVNGEVTLRPDPAQPSFQVWFVDRSGATVNPVGVDSTALPTWVGHISQYPAQ